MHVNAELLAQASGYLEGGSDALDDDTAAIAARYKRDVCKNYLSLNPDQLHPAGRHAVLRHPQV